MLTFAPTEGASIFDAHEGRVVLWFPAPGLAAASVHRHVTGVLARQAYARIDEEAVVPLEGFLDMYETTGFDWEARGRAVKWNLVHLCPRMMLHILVQTPPLVVAMKVFRQALRDHVEIHTRRDTFASAYNLAVRRRTRAAPSHPPPRWPSQ